MTRLPLLLSLCLGAALPAGAQTADTASTILVLDASGSMWGQIDGVNKIVIARDVVGELLTEWPADHALGLAAYGHRTRGDCSDIETIIAPALGTTDAIRDAVAGINPRGRTPMTQAVLEAARALRYTENAATVILVSDGIETCEADPCAVAAELEASGVDFTAHVVGFDVRAEPLARDQLSCIAENTGGRFLMADNADELARALTEVASVTTQPEPEPVVQPAPEPIPVTFAATLQRGDVTRALDTGVVFEVLRGTDIVMDATEAASPGLSLAPGDYVLRAYRIETEEQLEVPFTVGTVGLTITAAFDEALPAASLNAPASGVAGSEISVTWSGPNAEGDYIDTALIGAEAGAYQTYSNTMDGSPLPLRLPAQPGDYVIRYIMADGFQVLAERAVSVSAQQSGLSAPATATIGATIEVHWSGGGFDEDYIDTARPGAEPSDYATFSYVRDGNPLALQMPLDPGTYEIRYITGQDLSVFERTTIELSDIPTTLTAPPSGSAGSEMQVSWTGPGFQSDYLTIARPEDGVLGYETYVYVVAGTKATITLPDTPGTYELRYIAEGRTSRIMAAQPLVVE